MGATEIILRAILYAILMSVVPYFVGYWFTRGMMAARMKGPPIGTSVIIRTDAEARG